MQLVRDNIIDDTLVSDNTVWSSIKVGQHVYTTPALYKKPYFAAFTMDVDSEVFNGTNVGGSRVCSFQLLNYHNSNRLSLYINSTLITSDIMCDCGYHMHIPVTTDNHIISSGETVVYTLKSTNTLGQEFSINYEIKAV